MINKLMIALAVLLLLPAPAQAQPKSDYLQNTKKLPSKTFDANLWQSQQGGHQARTADGSSKKKAGVKRSKKQRREDRRRRGQQKKNEARFGTFNR